MSNEQLQEALQKFRTMERSQVYEVAQVYLLGILNMDKPNEIEENWEKIFENKSDFQEADSLRQSTIDSNEIEALLRIAVETTLVLKPDTKADFIEAVENAGEKMVVIEVAILAIAAAMLIREVYTKGRLNEIKIRKYNDEGILIEERSEIKFAKDSPFASLLAKLGLDLV